MKKLFALILSLCFAITPACCTITDDFADKSLDKNLKIKPPSKITIQDDFAESNKNKNPTIKKCGYVQEILPKVSDTNKFHKKIVIIDSNPELAVPVRICKTYSTKHKKFDEGDYINFITTKDVTIGKTTYPQGTFVNARIENISRNTKMGIPSDLVVGNFSIEGIPLAGEICKTGANRSLWVRPCAYILSGLFGIGLPIMFIRGGHAKIKPNQVYILESVE